MKYLLTLLLTFPLAAQDVFVPPVPKGIAREGKVRTPREIPFPSEDGEWLRVQSPRFDVISSATNDRTRELVKDIETLANALGAPVSSRATLFLFAKRRESQPYFDLLFASAGATSAGAYVRHDGGGTMFIDGARGRRIERTAMHELIHDLLRQHDVVPPLWLEEGLAEYFSSAVVDDDRVIAGDLIPEHDAFFKRQSPMPLEKLFAIKPESSEAASTAFYAQSWAVVEWLMYVDDKKFFPLLYDVARGTDLAAALKTHYDRSTREMESAVRVRDRGARRVTFDAARPSIPDAKPLDRATLLYELGDFLTHVAGAEKEAQRHFAEALRINPKHARTLAATGDLEGAVAAAPNDPEVHLMYAEVLMTTATGPFAGIFDPTAGDDEKFRRARRLATHALKIGGDEGRARGLIGTSMLVEDDLTPGIAELERARVLLPQRMDFALNLYAMHLATGNRAKADALFAAAFANSRDKQILFAARNVLLAAETTRANQFAAVGKLDEAAAIVRQLAAATADARGRGDLERQAAHLESIATVNRHIARYNEAVALTNRGKKREAKKILDELLKVATDPLVIQDVKRLRAEL
ncbi:MAG TPA: hypothetical protein VEK11_19500 [Thermoanaerobaculia bacterium]|nr:hypothetical protein [Thermoanaerobaculia bacterium]